ncbi:helix-turn-helix domain-containing protein [Chryseobacterium gotjawalense]|uniref:Helix-turn-helix domain-containing protein n=1 Tax=Chryseobacterium gotjawalense TaxID=3042315 RepID=A0ABY8RFL5_9FLAO|nr:helix-turn-helix domain-containing protein [Chryseobacterium sp. wdc7]WHF52766.1 helix-turn-helix domain-containing protein [Chryseobacterium sp. wdc7]
MSKKQDILDAALNIFTEVGTSAASTKSIAIEAHVSEALIFKHFKNKDNLIEEIVKSGYREATRLVAEHLEYKTPENYISNLLDLPKILVLSNKNFWQMQYKITPLNVMAMTHHQLFMKSSHELLVKAFAALGYEEPELEAEILLFIIDGLWKYIAANEFDTDHIDAIIRLAKKKYRIYS